MPDNDGAEYSVHTMCTKDVQTDRTSSEVRVSNFAPFYRAMH